MGVRQQATALPLFLILVMVLTFPVPVKGNDTLKKQIIKQRSKFSDRYNYYNEKRNIVEKGSKNTGLDARKVKGYGGVGNWVEIERSSMGNPVTGAVKSMNPFRDNSQGMNPDKNLGVIVDHRKNVDNTVIIKNSRVENAIVGGDVNSGIIIKSKTKINGRNYKNKVTIENSRVGGAAGLLKN